MLDWTDFPDAPELGTPVCPDADLGAGVTSLSLGEFPVLLVKDSQGTRAFVNACPHQFLPLDQRGDILGSDGTRLICTNHDATFDSRTGDGVSGFGLNCKLSLVPIKLRKDMWVIET